MAVSDQTRSGELAETFKSERETTKNQISRFNMERTSGLDDGAK